MRARADAVVCGLEGRIRAAGCQGGRDMDGERLLERYGLAPRGEACGPCRASFVAIGPEGELYRCQEYVGRAAAYACGDVFTGEVENEEWRRFVNAPWPTERCGACPILPLCHGGCRKNLLDRGAEALCSEGRCAERVEDARGRLAELVEELLAQRAAGAGESTGV